MCELWAYKGDDCHPIYKNIREVTDDESGRWCQGVRQHVADLWTQFKPHVVDPHFVEEFRRNPEQRYWEMRLACCLLNAGFDIKNNANGPDFLLKIYSKKTWIEAVTPTRGDKGSLDRIPESIANGNDAVSRNRIILRFRSALHDKEEKFKKDIKNGLIGKDDIKVIALSAAELWGRPLGDVRPYILSAVFPIGLPYILLERGTGQHVGKGNHFQPAIAKANGAEVETLFFSDPAHSNISGVIYSEANIGNPHARPGDDIFVIHNPLAANPLPRRLIPCSREYWAEDKGDSWDLRYDDLASPQQ